MVEIYQCINQAAYYYKVNPYVLVAIAKVESNFNPYAVNTNKNGTVDHGLFQINSRNLERLGIPVRAAYHPCYAAYIGAYILRQCMNRYGNTWQAIDCYNKGSKAKHTSQYVYKVYREVVKYSKAASLAGRY